MLRIIGGLIGIIVGFFITWKSLWFLEMIGRQKWSEKVFGNSLTGYKVIGIAVILISLLTLTGLIEKTVLWIFGPFLGG